VCETDEEAGEVYERISAERNAVTFPVGGSNEVGIRGYIAAAAELHEQRADIDKIVVPVGSAGTAAGLAAGIKMLGWPVTLIGACVSHTETESRQDVERLAGPVAIQLTDRAVGAGYGIPTSEMWDAVRLFARTEGITLEPVYNGKAAAALVDMIRNGEIDKDETVVFLHTGGLPGLFAYAPDLIASV
jgi:1-aminocyclopropane-1-carboxylate deaminase/D-cysteine desulfhydrase-like pyridoxal-dependent ACC family enzyme